VHYGLFLFGAVPMADTGAGPPAPTDRRTTNEIVWDTTERLVDMGVAAEMAGFEYFFLTEHHFQHEGYEVVPNSLMVGLVLAERTETIKIGALVHVVPQWHPLRFAEDFATLHNFSRGRAVLGVGRGTVPREAIPLGAVIGSTDDPVQRAEQDALNRARYDEAIEVIRLALDEEKFSFRGEHYTFPPDGIPDRGGTVEELTLVPRPLYPYETWQTITSPPTLEAVSRRGFGGVWWNLHPDFLREQWDRFAEVWSETHGETLAAGDKRMLVIQLRIDDTHERAVAKTRPPHDEFWKFLGPYGRFRGYKGPDGKRATDGFLPTLEISMEQRICLVGTAEDVAEQLTDRISALDARYVTLFPMALGDHYDEYLEQIQRYQEDLLPLLPAAAP
jgi:alkanesulfonate monooxygenase SsuD/methylene tetrahydromethanopterin reductase-like flavin-dependent oxidoreductase (luciferase family)